MKPMIVVAFGLLAVTEALMKDGQEFIYEGIIDIGAGTMVGHYEPHVSSILVKPKYRIQTSNGGKQLNVEVSEYQVSQYNGKLSPDMVKHVQFKPLEMPLIRFVINYKEDGSFSSIQCDNSLPLYWQNHMRAFAAFFQLKSADLTSESAETVSSQVEEETVHGKCTVWQSVSNGNIYKSYVANRDCPWPTRQLRGLASLRGHYCDSHRIEIGGLFSRSLSILKYKVDGDGYVITKLDSGSDVSFQGFQSAGPGQSVLTNVSLRLVNTKASVGDIVGGNTMITSLAVDFGDQKYLWDQQRNLKKEEPIHSIAVTEDAQDRIILAFKKKLSAFKKVLHTHGTLDEDLKYSHQNGINSFYPLMHRMNYNSLMSLADELMPHKSEEGVMKANLFIELLGDAGTAPAALAIRDLIMSNKFDNSRDAAFTLTSLPYHIRKPSKQLVEEMEKLLKISDPPKYLRMVIPLAFGHLVGKTCEWAGIRETESAKQCRRDFASKYVRMFYEKFKAASTRDDKLLYISAISNIGKGGIFQTLKPLILGNEQEETAEMRTAALWAVAGETWTAQMKLEMLFPLVMNAKEDHEIRISALSLILYKNPTVSELTHALTTMWTEKDYELYNFLFTLVEKVANSIQPCDHKFAEMAKNFLNVMKKTSNYQTDWSFGVSKTFKREYFKSKYGYGGAFEYYVTGAHDSATPLSLGMSISSTILETYQMQPLGVHLRIEGLGKSLIRKFKTMDPAKWKTAELKDILTGQMGIRQHPHQPVRVAVKIKKGKVVIFQRAYDEESTKQDGTIAEFIDAFMKLGDSYSINHLRSLQFSSGHKLMPTVFGIPAFLQWSNTGFVSIKAKVKRGVNRGMLIREVSYDAHLFGQFTSTVGFQLQHFEKLLSTSHDRFYHAHMPRQLQIGLNPLRKEAMLHISRPEFDDPLMLIMHSINVVAAQSTSVAGKPDNLKDYCPTCEPWVIVSKGPTATKSRDIVNYENEREGYHVHAKYFDCELNIGRGNTMGRGLAAFMPYNKNPRTPWAMFSLGLRQIGAFLALFPKEEKCGLMFHWSQSKKNPVREVQMKLRLNTHPNGERLFYRGRRWEGKLYITFVGDIKRMWKVLLLYRSTPGNLENALKLHFQRTPVPDLAVEPYVACLEYNNKYPDFFDDILAVDLDNDMKMDGQLVMQYGEGISCEKNPQGEIRATFEYSTTPEAREYLKQKWYYQKCMEQKNSVAYNMKTGNALPATESCYYTVKDASSARRMELKIRFVKLTNRMRRIISTVRGMLSAALLPYRNIGGSAGEYASADGNGIGAFINIDANLHHDDKRLDFSIETSQGEKNYTDLPLSLDWSNGFRSLRLNRMVGTFLETKVLHPCISTFDSVRTLDNKTYSYNAADCWTLISGHCVDKPTYAVFTKKVSGTRPLAMKAFVGGHEIEIDANANLVKVNGNQVAFDSDSDHVHSVGGKEIFSMAKLGDAYHIYSFLRVWIMFNGNFVYVLPAPSVHGEHCGMCGNYNRNPYDELTGKDGKTELETPADMVTEWKWKC